MGYIHKEVYEKDLLDEIANIFVEQGWELKGEFYKTAVLAYMNRGGTYSYVDTAIFTPHDKINGVGRVMAELTKHYIVSPPNSDMHYGIAMKTDAMIIRNDDVDPDKWIGNFATIREKEEGEEEQFTTYYNYSQDGLDSFGEEVVRLISKRLNKNRIYLYMTAKEPKVEDIAILKVGNFEQSSLDLSVTGTYGRYRSYYGSTFVGEIDNIHEGLLQSPISVMRTRSIDIVLDDSISEKYPINNTNWHDDSLFEISGTVEKDFAFLVIQADGAAAYDNNITPSIPFFFGRFTALNEDDDRNYALIAGSAFKKDDPRYDFDDPKPFDEKPMMPILQQYPSNPSNGIDNVTVFRTKGGAYYQAHHLFVEVDPNVMPPKREYDGRKYPSAWQQADADPYDYQMNPSRYTGEAHASKIYIAHMDEGVRGYLDGIIGMNPISLLDGDTLKNKVAWCEDGYDEYTFKVLSSVSPFTKMPSTPFRPLGLGIIKKRHEEGN